MKKLMLPLLFAAVFTCALYAAKGDKADDTTSRIDFTAAAGEATILSGAGTGAAAAAQPDAQQGTGKAGLLKIAMGGKKKMEKQAEEPPPVGVSYMEFDLMSIARSVQAGGIDLNFRMGYGDYQNFGFQMIFDGYMLSKYSFLGFAFGMDLAFSVYPLGNAPAGWYLSLVFGGRANTYALLQVDKWWLSIPLYGETGYRLNLGGFIADLSFSYGAEISFDKTDPVILLDYTLRAGIGWTFDDYPPAGKKPEEAAGDAKKEPEKKEEKQAGGKNEK